MAAAVAEEQNHYFYLDYKKVSYLNMNSQVLEVKYFEIDSGPCY